MTFSWEVFEYVNNFRMFNYYTQLLELQRIKIPCSSVIFKETPLFMADRQPVKMPRLMGGGFNGRINLGYSTCG